MHATLRRDYHPSPVEAISFKAGERLVVGAVDPDWPDYVEATDAHGRRGRVPLDAVDGEVARRDYDGRELSANEGDAVFLTEQTGGWWWARNAIGETGWLPDYVLSIEQIPE